MARIQFLSVCALLLCPEWVMATPQTRSAPNSRVPWVAGKSELKINESLMEPEIEIKIVKNYAPPPSDKSPKKIVIMGGPASGKGTQSNMIASKYNLVHLSTGDMLREAVKTQPHHPTIKIANQYMNAGKLVPDEIIIRIVMERIQKPDCQERGWLLDGFPRTLAQAEAMEEMGIQVDTFLFLNVPDKTMIERVVGRRIDPVSGKIYHMTFSPPPTEDI